MSDEESVDILEQMRNKGSTLLECLNEIEATLAHFAGRYKELWHPNSIKTLKEILKMCNESRYHKRQSEHHRSLGRKVLLGGAGTVVAGGLTVLLSGPAAPFVAVGAITAGATASLLGKRINTKAKKKEKRSTETVLENLEMHVVEHEVQTRFIGSYYNDVFRQLQGVVKILRSFEGKDSVKKCPEETASQDALEEEVSSPECLQSHPANDNVLDTPVKDASSESLKFEAAKVMWSVHDFALNCALGLRSNIDSVFKKSVESCENHLDYLWMVLAAANLKEDVRTILAKNSVIYQGITFDPKAPAGPLAIWKSIERTYQSTHAGDLPSALQPLLEYIECEQLVLSKFAANITPISERLIDLKRDLEFTLQIIDKR